jgi:hypothetical protein
MARILVTTATTPGASAAAPDPGIGRACGLHERHVPHAGHRDVGHVLRHARDQARSSLR